MKVEGLVIQVTTVEGESGSHQDAVIRPTDQSPSAPIAFDAVHLSSRKTKFRVGQKVVIEIVEEA